MNDDQTAAEEPLPPAPTDGTADATGSVNSAETSNDETHPPVVDVNPSDWVSSEAEVGDLIDPSTAPAVAEGQTDWVNPEAEVGDPSDATSPPSVAVESGQANPDPAPATPAPWTNPEPAPATHAMWANPDAVAGTSTASVNPDPAPATSATWANPDAAPQTTATWTSPATAPETSAAWTAPAAVPQTPAAWTNPNPPPGVAGHASDLPGNASIRPDYSRSDAGFVPAEPSRYFADTGRTSSGPFLAFLDHYGPTLCGHPITDVVVEGGVRRQYFQHLAIEEHVPGRVRLLPLGEHWLNELRARQTAPLTHGPAQAPTIVNLVTELARHATHTYATRPLADIRYLVIHHTGAPAGVGPRDIARAHVDENDWPGIGYHFVVDADGTLFQTQDLTTVSFHARQFNPVSVGIAFMGDLSTALPTHDQLDRAAGLLAKLLADLGLPMQMVRGHREMVPTDCPGEGFLQRWKPELIRAIGAKIG